MFVGFVISAARITAVDFRDHPCESQALGPAGIQTGEVEPWEGNSGISSQPPIQRELPNFAQRAPGGGTTCTDLPETQDFSLNSAD
jgi:hypothetical protein